MYYASVADVISGANTPGGNSNTNITAANKADLLRFIRVVSKRINLELKARRPLFLPYKEARKFLVESDRVNSLLNTFNFGEWLLDLTALTVGESALTVGTAVELYPDANQPPFKQVRLTDYAGWYAYPMTTGAPSFVTATGLWGYHADYANAWLKVDDLAAGIDADDTTITVADADGEDDNGYSPRLSEGQLLRIENEYLLSAKVNKDTNVVTVKRGVNGTTAAAHSSGADVEVWQVEDPIRQVTARQAAFMWMRRGSYTAVEVTAMTEVRYPPDLLAELRAVLQEYDAHG